MLCGGAGWAPMPLDAAGACHIFGWGREAARPHKK